ncbi:hypothetical protein BLNAU_3678 [Blattamonas nauphoetae]|uniref:PH domain-containing protein n=1 Tax=Blattamonas nauphoetae TaxID=2049346 RepID=A0ABQ9YBU5_9EUKA|nr:hypothetical protein BLNAU_3678 [Blattamonas nauphoetae]
MLYLHLIVKSIDARELDLPAEQTEKMQFVVQVDKNVVSSPIHSTKKIYQFSNNANFALLPERNVNIKLQLFNAKRKPFTFLGEYSLSSQLLSEKQDFRFLQMEGIPGQFHVSFALGHELAINSILRSTWAEVHSGLLIKTFTNLWVTLTSTAVVAFKDQEMGSPVETIPLETMTIVEEPESTLKKTNILSLTAPPQPIEGKPGQFKQPTPRYIKFETSGTRHDWFDALTAVKNGSFYYVLQEEHPDIDFSSNAAQGKSNPLAPKSEVSHSVQQETKTDPQPSAKNESTPESTEEKKTEPEQHTIEETAIQNASKEEKKDEKKEEDVEKSEESKTEESSPPDTE